MSKADTAKILFKGILNPSDWSNPASAYDLKYDLEKYFSTKVYPLNSGRSAIYTILKSLGIGEGDEVIVQAYTCNAVPNPILWNGATPVYADIDENTLNTTVENLEEKISEKTKAIILQHTFGRPGPVEEAVKLAKKHKLILIEDCAHSLGAKYKGKKLGTFGDLAIISFGREKVISSLAGGAIFVNKADFEKPIAKFISNLNYPSFYTFLKEFNNYFTWRLLIRRILFKQSGKRFLSLLNKHDFFNVVTSQKELVGEKPSWYPKLLPGTLAKIAIQEFSKLEDVNRKRNKIAKFYEKNIKNNKFRLLDPHSGIYLRFVLRHKNPSPVFLKAEKRGFWFGNWYDAPIYPQGINTEKFQYKSGSCLVAEKVASETLNLPNYPGMTESEAQKIVNFINSYEL